jgi:hypothetical protein
MSDTVTIPAVESLAADLQDQPDYCLRPHQRVEYEEEAGRLRSIADAPDWQAGAAKIAAQQRYRQVLNVLRSQAPKPIDDTLRRDRVAKGANAVLNDVIRPSMLTKAEMRRNPAGAVGEFMRRENSPAVQRAIRTWQRARFALDPTTTNDDHALIEKHRPEGAPTAGYGTFMADAQIPGVFGFGPQARENWPLDPPQNTALEQSRRAERDTASIPSTGFEPDALPAVPKPKRPMSAAQAAALSRGRANRASNIAAVSAPVADPVFAA